MSTDYLPAVSPPEPRRPKRRIIAWTALPRVIAAAVFLVVVAIAELTGKPSSAKPPAAKHALPAAVTASASPVAGSCDNEAYVWTHAGGGQAGLTALASDFSTINTGYGAVVAALASGGSDSAALSQTMTYAGNLGRDARNDLNNPPPSCIPGGSAPYRRAMNEAIAASTLTIESAGQIGADNISAARKSIKAWTRALNKSEAALSAATAALQAFSASNGG